MKATQNNHNAQTQHLPVQWLEEGGAVERLNIGWSPCPLAGKNRPVNRRARLSAFRRAGARAFTLIELLVVIAIMGILAALLFTALKGSKETAKKLAARTDMKNLETAIQAYHSTYNRYPLPTNVISADFTFGDTDLNIASKVNGFTGLNSELMAILLDDPDVNHANANHQKNPQQTPFMHISKRATDVSQPGLGPDLVFRDPWSRAYNISLDYDYDDMCRDSIYSLEKVSSSSTTDKQAGFNGLTRPSGLGDTFILRAPVMIWSSGPDRGIDPTTSANLSSNKDNILSWTR